MGWVNHKLRWFWGAGYSDILMFGTKFKKPPLSWKVSGCAFDSCGKYMKDILVKKIKENGFFSVLADEESDCSNQEQLSLVIRFVDGSGAMREEFLGFQRCDLALSWKTLAETVLNSISSLALDMHMSWIGIWWSFFCFWLYQWSVWPSSLHKWESYILLLWQPSVKLGCCCILQYSDC